MKTWQPVLAGMAFLTVTLLVLHVTGLLGAGYEWVWQHTTGRPYTYIMRDHPYLLVLPAAAILSRLTRKLPLRYWARLVYMTVVAGVFFLAGHVFW